MLTTNNYKLNTKYMLTKSLTLGVAKISFEHQYEKKLFLNKKTKEGKLVNIPVATKVVVEVPTEEMPAIALSVCSKNDHFTYEDGRKIAMKKAISSIKSITKEEKRQIWDDYNMLKPGGRW